MKSLKGQLMYFHFSDFSYILPTTKVHSQDYIRPLALKMNFAQAVKGHKAKIKISIWCQAETELGRMPTPEEKKLALTNTSQKELLGEIEKVICYI